MWVSDSRQEKRPDAGSETESLKAIGSPSGSRDPAGQRQETPGRPMVGVVGCRIRWNSIAGVRHLFGKGIDDERGNLVSRKREEVTTAGSSFCAASLRGQDSRRRRHRFGPQPVDAFPVGAVEFGIVARTRIAAGLLEEVVRVLAVDRPHEGRAEIVADKPLELLGQFPRLLGRQCKKLVFLLAQPTQREIDRHGRARLACRLGTPSMDQVCA